MDIKHTEPNHVDERGIIQDILTHEAIDAVTFITYEKPGMVRANHYHEHSVQWDYVISGKLECYVQQGEDGEIEMKIIGPGDLVKHPINERHALKAIEPSVTLSLTQGPRRGKDYEQDVIRLTDEEKLVQ